MGGRGIGHGLVAGIFGTALVAVAAGVWMFAPPSRMRVVVQFLGYTNVAWGEHVGVIQVSNASPVAIVRGRSPQIVSDSPTGLIGYAPTGWKVLAPGECELIHTDSLKRGVRWKLVVTCERLGGDSYGIGRPDARERLRQGAIWLQDHGVPAPEPKQRPALRFSSDWVDAER
jgi:hypothetical protein